VTRNSIANIIAYAVPTSSPSIRTIIVSLIPIPEGEPGVINPRSHASEKQVNTRNANKLDKSTFRDAVKMNKTPPAKLKKHKYMQRTVISSTYKCRSGFTLGILVC